MDGKQSPNEEPAWQFKPGETVSPRQQAAVPETAQVAAAQPAAVVASESPAPQPVQTTQESLATVAAAAPSIADPAAAPATDGPAPSQMEGSYISWTASEFIAHEKSTGWHVGLVAIAVLIAVLAWFIFKDIVTALVIIFAGVALSYFGARRPNQLQYQLGDQGLQIGNKYYAFGDFRSFSVIPEGAIASIALTPSRRFAPLVTLYFDPQDGDKIVGILGDHLPHQERKADAIDGLMRRIRF
jgi:hypothetical protein